MKYDRKNMCDQLDRKTTSHLCHIYLKKSQVLFEFMLQNYE
jgi:hypothetical protein